MISTKSMANCNQGIIGSLRHRISLQESTLVSDGQGGYTETWENYADVWADVKPLKSYEKFQAATLQTPTSHKITIRYRQGVLPKHRIKFGERIMDIKGIINVNEDSAFLEIMALEKI